MGRQLLRRSVSHSLQTENPLPAENLLEPLIVCPVRMRGQSTSPVTSRWSSLLIAFSADVRSSDDVIAFKGLNIRAASNIVFTNGLLDPWSSGGVMQNVSDSLVSVVLDLGAHHLDLMFTNPADPPCVKDARAIQEANILKWVQQSAAGRSSSSCVIREH